MCQACSGPHSKDKTCKGVRQFSDVTGARSKDKTCKGVGQFSDVTGARSEDKTCKGVRQFSDVQRTRLVWVVGGNVTGSCLKDKTFVRVTSKDKKSEARTTAIVLKPNPNT